MKRGVVERYLVILIITLVTLVVLIFIIMKGQPYLKGGLERIFSIG